MPESRETPRRTIRLAATVRLKCNVRTGWKAEIAAEAQLKRSGAINYVVHAYDLSEHGCKIEFVERPRLGETVWVKFEGLEALRSTVRWTEDFTAGLQFEHAIDPRVLESLIKRLR